MSYNLLLDTNFTNIQKHWKLTNCKYVDGYLVSNSNVFSIEQEITLPNPTKLYFAIDYIAFDKDIKYVYAGIQSDDVLEATRKKPRLNNRKKLSVVDSVKTETVKVIFIIESKSENSKIYIDSPLLIDLVDHNKEYWPKFTLDQILDYRYGYNYINEYKESEISITNSDFSSPYSDCKKANTGIVVKVKENDWFRINWNKIPGHFYLVKLDLTEVNKYGQLYLKYGEIISEFINDDQLYIIFKSDEINELRLYVENREVLPYIINLKRLLIIDLINQIFEEDDIQHLPFI